MSGNGDYFDDDPGPQDPGPYAAAGGGRLVRLAAAQAEAAKPPPAPKYRCNTCQDTFVVTARAKRHAYATWCPDCGFGPPSKKPCPRAAKEEEAEPMNLEALFAAAQRRNERQEQERTCTDGTIFARDEEGRLFSYRCPVCGPFRRGMERYNLAKIPRDYAGARFRDVLTHAGENTAEVAAAYEECKRVAKGWTPESKGLLLSGPVGCGKTHLLIALLEGMTLGGLGGEDAWVLYADFGSLLDRARASFSDPSMTDEMVWGNALAAKLLFIDEIGKNLETQWQRDQFDRLISRRYERGFCTVGATNFPFDQPSAVRASKGRTEAFRVTTLEEKLGERLTSRMAQMMVFHRMERQVDFRRSR